MPEKEQNANKNHSDQTSVAPDGTLPEKSPATAKARPIPTAHAHVQVNFCKTPGCENFGISPEEGLIPIPFSRPDARGYKIGGTSSSDLHCGKCGKWTRIKSNRAIHEEFERQGGRHHLFSDLCCTNPQCANHLPSEEPASSRFRRYGKTPSGSDRWQCRLCKKTISIGKPTRKQKKSHKNIQTFELLVNKMPLSRMCEALDVNFATLYGKIDFIYRQCRAFAAERERHLSEMEFDRLYLCTDRQDYIVNWGDRTSRRTIQLTAIATADQDSGYIFGFAPNFDASITPDELEAAYLKANDAHLHPALRQCARLWTKSDYSQSSSRAWAKKEQPTRDDLDAPEHVLPDQQLPDSGCQVHADYLMHGHYWLLRSYFPKARKLRFFLDGDPGLLAACLGAFADRVKDRTADVVIVDISKGLKTTDRNSKFAAAKSWFEQEKRRFPELSMKMARTAILAEQITQARKESPLSSGQLQSAWMQYPFPTLAEPEKRLRYVTDHGDFDDHHLANLLLRATLAPVDTAFNQVRRRFTMFERPVTSKSRAGGLWHIYAPYNPAMIQKMLTIYRVWHNYVGGRGTKEAPAQKFGLAKGRIRIQDILYFDVRQYLT